MSEAAEKVEESTEVDSIEERARLQGWRPKDEYKGDESRWVDAETFIARGEDQVPILKERFHKLEADYLEQKKTLEALAKHHKETAEREYKRALADLKKQKAEAVANGDSDAFIKIEEDEERLRSEKEAKKEESAPAVHPDWSGWVADNTWYTSDKEAKEFADFISAKVGQENPHLVGRAFFDAVKDRVKKAMPQKFENPRRKDPPHVEGDGGGRRTGKKGYTDLPPEAKAACDKFVKQGVLTKEQYIKDFFGE